MAKRRIIWSNENLDLKDWEEDIKENYPNASQEEMYSIMHDMNSEYLEDERRNLNIQLENPIVVIADLGLWDGRRNGYKLINSGNIRDCLYSDSDYVEWYVDGYGDFRCTATHHDGTNYYLYREFKSGVSENQIDNFLNKIYKGTVTTQDISRITRKVGDRIAKVYGW